MDHKRKLIAVQNNISIYIELLSDNQAFVLAVDKHGNESREKFEDSVSYVSGNHKFKMKYNDFCNLLLKNNQSLSVDKIIARAEESNKTIIFYHGKDKKMEQVWGVKCNLCGHESKKYARNFNQCSGCNNLNKVTDNKVFKKSAGTKHNNRYFYSDDYVNSYTKIKILCKCGHIFYQRPNDHLRGSGCPKCKISSGELAIEKWMLDHNKDYIWQHKFENLKNVNHLILDFYCPSKNMIIEYDGEGHTELSFYIKRGIKDPEKKLKAVQHNDSLKDQYAEENGMKMLRISFKDKKRINEILNQNFNGN